MRLALAILCCSALGAAAAVPDIIDSSRRITWQGNVGVVGGIPDSSAMLVYTTFTATATAAMINNALANCPSNKVVACAAGSYTMTDDVVIGKDGVVLRGAGMNSTFFNFNGSSNERLKFTKPFSAAALSVDADLSVNGQKGSNVLTLASVPSWVTVGELIGIDELNIFGVVSNGADGTISFRTAEGNGNRGMGQLNRVTAKTATTITCELPMFETWSNSLTAQVWEPYYDLEAGDKSLKRAGVEGIMFYFQGTGNDSHGISLEIADNCWVKNCGITNTYGGSAIMPFFCYRCEFRGNLVHTSHLYTGGQGYGITPWDVTTACLIEDNILYDLHNPLSYNLGAAGNVIAYNFVGLGHAPLGNEHPGMGCHAVHPHMNLFEGNFTVDKLLGDWTHGSSSDQTAFRNRIVGTNGPGDGGSCVSIAYYNKYWNLVGNIVGSGQQGKRVSSTVSTAEGVGGSVYKMGGVDNYANDYSPGDVYSYTTGMFVLDHMNWDYLTTTNGGIVWEPAVTNYTLVNSYYLPSKPALFGLLSWPPYDPYVPFTGTNVMAYTNIPAGYRYAFGTNPPTVVPTSLTVTRVASFGRALVGGVNP